MVRLSLAHIFGFIITCYSLGCREMQPHRVDRVPAPPKSQSFQQTSARSKPGVMTEPPQVSVNSSHFPDSPLLPGSAHSSESSIPSPPPEPSTPLLRKTHPLPLPPKLDSTATKTTTLVKAVSSTENSSDVLPPPRKEAAKPIELTLDETDVRKALELVSRQGNLNMLISPAVTGRVTGNVKGLTPADALAAIVKLANLQIHQENDLVFVFTPEEVSRGIGADGLFLTRVYRLNYARSTDILNMIRPLLSSRGKATATPPSQVGLSAGFNAGGTGLSSQTGGGGGSAGSGGSSAGGGSGGGGASSAGGAGGGGTAGGGISGGNSLAGSDVVVVQDQESILRQIDYVIGQLDVPPQQVEIEAILLSLSHDKNVEFGVDLAVLSPNGRVLGVFGNGTTINATVGFDPQLTTTTDGLLRGNAGRGLAADTQGFRIGITGPPLTSFVRALERLGKVQILASPRLLVLNKQAASLLLGQRLGYSVASQNLVSTVQQIEFLNVGTQLYVRPFISCDGNIRLEIHPERSSGRIVNNIPQASTSEVTTNVMVPNNGTLVIAGLVDQVDDRQQNGTPFLHNLPLVGALFRERIRSISRQELVVILRPRIIPPFSVAMPHPICPPQMPSPPAFVPPPAVSGSRLATPVGGGNPSPAPNPELSSPPTLPFDPDIK